MRLLMALITSMLAATPALAQQIDIPRPSPAAKVSQTAGLTEISVDYSSPAAHGRTIFGGVVPYGAVWRTGANSATKISFSKDVTIGGKTVPAGTYALFTLPEKDRWTFIVNKDAGQFGAFQYKQADDVVRVESRPSEVSLRERMTFVFSDTTDDATRLDLEWDRTRVSLPIQVNTDLQVTSSIQGLERSGWRPWNAAAQYLLNHKRYDEAARLVDQSLRIKEDWQNDWTKAQLLAAQGKNGDARAFAEKAQALGSKDQNFFAADDVQKFLAQGK
jgi:hypothetical protein